jgi:hypothetical protein
MKRYACRVLTTTLLCGATFAAGETIIVDTPADTVDFGGAQGVADLPGPDGETSFAEAVTAANNTAGPQTIAFNIPLPKWSSLSSEFAYIDVGFGALVVSDDGLIVDGTTQTAFTGDTNPDGAEIGFFNTSPNSAGTAVLLVMSDDNVFTGLGEVCSRGSLLEIRGHRNRVFNNQIHGPLFAAVELRGNHNVIGGTNPGEGNELTSATEGLRFTAPASANRIIGNPQIRGTELGIRLYVGADGNTIGGPTPAERNVISGSGYSGQQFVPQGGQILVESDGNVIQGNAIGVDMGGALPLPNEFGLCFGQNSGISPSADDNVVGGTGPGEGNLIAFNTRDGLKVGPDTMRITVSENSFHDNGFLGIGLDENRPLTYPDNVSTNDPGDADSGGNGRRNYPVIEAVTDDGLTTTVTGSLDTPAPETAVVEIFTAAVADPSSFGEGGTYRASAIPDATGSFVASFPGGLGESIFSATATDASGHTSEFSQAFGAAGNVTVYCTGKQNSEKCVPEMVGLGTPSASGGLGFDVRASLIVDGVNGLLFYSVHGPKAVAFQGGAMCVQGPVRRTPVQNSGGTFNCAGTFSFDFNAHIASGADPALVAGQQVWCQYWSRDSQSQSTTNLTDAMTFTIEP